MSGNTAVNAILQGAWVAQSVKRLLLAQVMFLRLMGLSPVWGSVLTARSLEPASDSVSPSLSAPSPLILSPSLSLSLCLSLSKINISNPYQNNTNILHRARTNNPKICTEPEKTPNSQSDLDKENQSRRHHNPRLQAVLQNCNHQDSMVLAQKQTLRSMEQNREPTNGPTNVWPTNL